MKTPIPDETTICKFRNRLIEKKLLKRIFEEVKNMMKEKNLIPYQIKTRYLIEWLYNPNK